MNRLTSKIENDNYCMDFYKDEYQFNFINKVVHIHVPKVGLYCETFSDCGKTWAFTKKELENELN